MRDAVPDTRHPTPGTWPEVIEALRDENKRIVAETLGDVEPVRIENGVVTLRHLGGNPMTPDSVIRNRGVIEAAASRVFGAPTRVELQSGEPSPSPDSQPAAPAARRLSPSAAKSERAKALKGRDPALDKAMEAMDLELLE